MTVSDETILKELFSLTKEISSDMGEVKTQINTISNDISDLKTDIISHDKRIDELEKKNGAIALKAWAKVLILIGTIAITEIINLLILNFKK